MSELKSFRIKKTNDAKQLVYGEVYVPGRLDSDGEFMVADEIEDAAHGFMKKSLMGNVDKHHDLKKSGALVVESFIAREGDPDFIVGSWVMGVWVPDAEWEQVQKGELNGFSMYGSTDKVERIVEIELPEDGIIIGKTEEANDHVHAYEVKYNDEGIFMGGATDTVDGHFHVIRKGTATEQSGVNDHSHRFSFLETIDGIT